MNLSEAWQGLPVIIRALAAIWSCRKLAAVAAEGRPA
jgi:hypothetical protein